jgi:hypothetical protein
MANIYKNAGFDLTTTDLTTIYTVPALRTAIVKSIQISNEHSSNNLVEIFVTDSSASATFEIYHISMDADSTAYQSLQQYAGLVSPIASGFPVQSAQNQTQSNPFSTAMGGALLGGSYGGGAGALIGGGLGFLGGLL